MVYIVEYPAGSILYSKRYTCAFTHTHLSTARKWLLVPLPFPPEKYGRRMGKHRYLG